ncbi:MAG: N-acetyltransferase [Nitrospinaceae bacterium]|jgi:putative acetyltransferase|nr:N-acetyltransferase [Nitrospina sp.]MBT5376661.1 N-acetyltransferase [Nitrospinaceae bacterium]MBT5867943.1 N-acetyltransferase [Nitrospinaceae bacterium]MBT6347394.1 N-acetyltransferase [Nitrospina sp.]
MNFGLYESSCALDVKKLFTDVFTNSEGEEEGNLIGNLAFELQETTDPRDIFGFLAKDGEIIAGCIFFTRMTFEISISAFILSPVAISTQYQNQGLGQKLIKFGINQMKNNDVDLIFTYGDPHYYSKVGFIHITEEIAKAPLKMTFPEGWLAQSLTSDKIEPIKGNSTCVKALMKQKYW